MLSSALYSFMSYILTYLLTLVVLFIRFLDSIGLSIVRSNPLSCGISGRINDFSLDLLQQGVPE